MMNNINKNLVQLNQQVQLLLTYKTNIFIIPIINYITAKFMKDNYIR